jgi:agmatine/peptidylarginine deiminase
MKSIVLCVAIMCSATAWAERAPKHFDLSLEHERIVRQRNENQKFEAPSVQPSRPYSELETAGYLFMSAEEDFDSGQAKQALLKHLPESVTAVLFTDPGSDVEEIKARFSAFVPSSRLRVVEIDRAIRGFWARDGLPVATWLPSGKVQFVDAKYYHGFEPDQWVASKFQSPLVKHNYYFEGGNFVINDVGDCLTVDNQRSKVIPAEVFTGHYGCKRLVRLPYEKGIGHADESVRFLRRNMIATDSDAYAKTLRAEGFEVIRLPRASGSYETYVNSLLIENVMYVPVFNKSADKIALKVYQDAGFKTVPVASETLSNDGMGSVHCITMTYPPMPFEDLVHSLKLKPL